MSVAFICKYSACINKYYTLFDQQDLIEFRSCKRLYAYKHIHKKRKYDGMTELRGFWFVEENERN